MTQVQTVRGPVETANLGRTLMHEHIFVLTPDVQQNHDEWDEDVRIKDAIEKLTALAEAGYDTIVDPTVIGLGRYIPRVEKIAAEVDLNIIVATGVYTYDTAPNFFRFRGPIPGIIDADPMAEIFVRDITEGIPGTNVRAAFLKCAIDEHGLTPDVERIMRSVSRAHRQTGAPITIHTHPGSQRGNDAHEVFASEGVDPTRVVLGHSGDSADPDHLASLADRGYILGMDRFGIESGSPFEQRVSVLVTLVERGYADRMVLAHDAACYIDWIAPSLLQYNSNWHYLHIENDVLPELRKRGVTDEQIDQMLVGNPRRYFDNVAPY